MATKKLVCDKVEFANLNMISSIDDQVVTFNAGYDWIDIKTRRAEISETLVDSEAGQSVNQSLSFAMAVDSSNLNLIKKPSVYRITLNDGTQFVWGSLDQPVRIVGLRDSLESGSTEVVRKAQDFEFS